MHIAAFIFVVVRILWVAQPSPLKTRATMPARSCPHYYYRIMVALHSASRVSLHALQFDAGCCAHYRQQRPYWHCTFLCIIPATTRNGNDPTMQRRERATLTALPNEMLSRAQLPCWPIVGIPCPDTHRVLPRYLTLIYLPFNLVVTVWGLTTINCVSSCATSKLFMAWARGSAQPPQLPSYPSPHQTHPNPSTR